MSSSNPDSKQYKPRERERELYRAWASWGGREKRYRPARTNRGWANLAAGDPTRRPHRRTFAATSPCLTYLAPHDFCLLRVWEKATETREGTTLLVCSKANEEEFLREISRTTWWTSCLFSGLKLNSLCTGPFLSFVFFFFLGFGDVYVLDLSPGFFFFWAQDFRHNGGWVGQAFEL